MRYYIKKVKSLMGHFDYVHCGVETLSMSKWVMDKVFDCSSDCGVKVYYQDTDSIHLHDDDDDNGMFDSLKENTDKS